MPPKLENKYPGGFRYTAIIKRVIDADTLEMRIDLGFDVSIKRSVRLAYIDTPESRTRNAGEKSWGLAAKKFVEDLVRLKTSYYICSIDVVNKGKFGRPIAIVHLNSGLILHEELINNGLACSYNGGNKESARRASGVFHTWGGFYKEPKKPLINNYMR